MVCLMPPDSRDPSRRRNTSEVDLESAHLACRDRSSSWSGLLNGCTRLFLLVPGLRQVTGKIRCLCAEIARFGSKLESASLNYSATRQSYRELEKQGEEHNWPEAARTYAALGLAFARVRQFLGEKQGLLSDINEKAS
jgi:hypothetical protein